MLRFAPSPTGDMHIANLRVALFNYLVSKQKNEDFIVRIEDIDKAKNIEGKDQEILDILDLFQIKYTQTIYQSENVRFHSAMALQLIHEKKAFSCFCSQNWLKKKKEEAKVAKNPYLYDDACANLPAELVIDNMSPFTIRIHKATQSITINDIVYLELSYTAKDMQSLVIMHQDKTPTYNFACAVDDMLHDISLVIRSHAHINETHQQEHIRTALAYEKKIEYAHLPELIGGESISVTSLLEEGFLPEAISNYLISISNTTPTEIFTMDEATQWLDLKSLSQSPTSFDKDRLREINKAHLQLLDLKELSRYVGFADEEIGALARVFLEDVSTTKELKLKIDAIFADKKAPKELQGNVKILSQTIRSAPYFASYDAFISHTMKVSGLQDEAFFKALAFILTGDENSSNTAKVYTYIKNYLGEIVK